MDISNLVNKLKMIGVNVIYHNSFGVIAKRDKYDFDVYLVNDDGITKIVHNDSTIRINSHFIILFGVRDKKVIAIYTKGTIDNKAESDVKYTEAVTDANIFTNLQSSFASDNRSLIMLVGDTSVRLISYTGKTHDIKHIASDGELAIIYNIYGDNSHTIASYTFLGKEVYGIGFSNELEVTDIKKGGL